MYLLLDITKSLNKQTTLMETVPIDLPYYTFIQYYTVSWKVGGCGLNGRTREAYLTTLQCLPIMQVFIFISLYLILWLFCTSLILRFGFEFWARLKILIKVSVSRNSGGVTPRTLKRTSKYCIVIGSELDFGSFAFIRLRKWGNRVCIFTVSVYAQTWEFSYVARRELSLCN